MVLLGGLENEPVKHGVVITAADLHIYGSKGKLLEEHTDLFDAIHGVDEITLVYYLVLLHLLCAILALSIRPPNMRWVWSRYRKCFWKCFELMVDQEDFHSQSWSARLLWLHLSLAVLVVVFVYFLSLLSTDAIVQIRPRTIDGFDDIFSRHFVKTVFHIAKNGFFYDSMKNSPHGSKLAKLHRKLQATSIDCKHLYECSIFDMGDVNDPNTINGLSTLAERCADGRSALLFPKQAVDQGTAIFSCLTIPHTTARVHASRQQVATGLLTSFHRHGLDDRVEQYTRYRMKRYTEMGVHQAVLKEFMESTAERAMGPKNSQYYKCREGYVDRPDNEISATVMSYRKTVKVSTLLVAMSVSSLVIECCSRRRRSCRRRRRR
ncbi:hypothetical protein HDE_06166 [Halotydeus destructor]|nr:hypothetical protein HDE_06166 [Halotydeus destructor]